MENQEATPEVPNQELTDNQVNNKTKSPKKKHRLLKFLAIFAGIIIIAAVILGMSFPGLLWTKDLGVKYTEADYQSAITKLEYIKDAIPTGSAESEYVYTYGKTSAINTEFTSSEITAFINTGRPSYYAVKNVQVRLNPDGTIDASGIVNVDYVLNEILGGKFSREQIAKEMPALGLLPGSVNLYINAGGSVLNNNAEVDLNKVEVQGIPIPTEYVNSKEAIDTVTGGANQIMQDYSSKSGSNFEKLAVENEKLVIKGDFPSSLTRTKK